MPNDPVSVAVALADKIDTLVGFWAIDENRRGARTRTALRRAALGVIRTVLETRLNIGRRRLVETHFRRVSVRDTDVAEKIDHLDAVL